MYNITGKIRRLRSTGINFEKYPKNFDDNNIERVRIVNMYQLYLVYIFLFKCLSIIINFSVDNYYKLYYDIFKSFIYLCIIQNVGVKNIIF